MEPQVCVVKPETSNEISIYTSTQNPRGVRKEVSRLLSLPLKNVNVTPMTVGGGFGGKHGLMEPLAAAISLKLNKTIRIELTRTEDFLTSTPSPGCKVYLKTGATKSGKFCAIEAKIIMDNGAFAGPWGKMLADSLGSVYQVPNVSIKYLEVNTNKPHAGAYRAPSAPLSSFVLESNIDMMTKKLKIDPIDFRIKNASKTGDKRINGDLWENVNIKTLSLIHI